MYKTFYLELPEEFEQQEVPVEVEGDWMHDGIGPYEFWGQKCFDRGTSYVEITDNKFDQTKFTPSQVAKIQGLIDEKLDEWVVELGEDYEPPSRY